MSVNPSDCFLFVNNSDDDDGNKKIKCQRLECCVIVSLSDSGMPVIFRFYFCDVKPCP